MRPQRRVAVRQLSDLTAGAAVAQLPGPLQTERHGYGAKPYGSEDETGGAPQPERAYHRAASGAVRSATGENSPLGSSMPQAVSRSVNRGRMPVAR